MKRVCGTLVGALSLALGSFGSIPSAEAFRTVSIDGTISRWDASEIRYAVDARGSDDFRQGCDGAGDCVSESRAIRSAFDAWSGVPGVKLTFVEDKPDLFEKTGYDKKNTLVWVESGWSDLPFSPPANALAVTVTTYKISNKRILDADIHFNGENFTWAVLDSEKEADGAVDIQNIATHEIGHFIGLEHSSEYPFEPEPKLYLAAMYFASGPGDLSRRQLNEDDVSAVTNLYPAEPRKEAQVTSVEPSVIDADTDPTALVRLTGSNFHSFTSAAIVLPGASQDLTARLTGAAAGELVATFELFTVAAGTYDLVVANSPDRVTRLKNALTIKSSVNGGNAPLSLEEKSSGGCRSDSGGFFWPLLLLFPALALRRRQGFQPI